MSGLDNNSCHLLGTSVPPEIPPGLNFLPRQIGGFPDFRRHMLSLISREGNLSHWRARSEQQDLGIMLLEMWAYILDIVGFYDARIAEESYLRTTRRRVSARRLTELIGYRPRPASASFATLAVMADGTEPVVVPERTGFRSEAFEGESPQIFEVAEETILHAVRNSWELGPIHSTVFDGTLFFKPDAPTPAENQVVLIRSGDDTQTRAGRVLSNRTETALDGKLYKTIELDADLSHLVGTPLGSIQVSTFSRTVFPNALLEDENDVFPSSESVLLNAIYPQFKRSDHIVIEALDGATRKLHPAKITGVLKREEKTREEPFEIQLTLPGNESGTASVDPPFDVFATEIRFEYLHTQATLGFEQGVLVHWNETPMGKPVNPALTRIGGEDFPPLPASAPLVGPVEPFNNTAPPDNFIIKGVEDLAYKINGHINLKGQAGSFAATDPGSIESPLRTTLNLFGNLVEVNRGESVFDEVLGSANASIAFQVFSLKNSPLTYLPDASFPGGLRPVLEVRVNGILWRQVQTFLESGPDDFVYVVRHLEEGETEIMFGDGLKGARPPSGVDNVTATYRYGAGAAKPPANIILKVAQPVPGIGSVGYSMAARGGSDAESRDDIKVNAPRSALTLGRAVSLKDYEAFARAFPGVVNAAAGWGWDESYQHATVVVWTITDGGDISEDLTEQLIAVSDRQTRISVIPAQGIEVQLNIQIKVDPDYSGEMVSSRVKDVLMNSDYGLFAPKNIKIGESVFKSVVLARVHSVDGVLSVSSMNLDEGSFPFALPVSQGQYRHVTGVDVIPETGNGS